MLIRSSLLFLPLAGLILLGCYGSDTELRPLTPKPTIFEGSGSILFVEVEGGCWTIKGDDGSVFEPIGLSDAFRKDGLRVRFIVRTLPDVATVCMVGQPVEVVDLQPLAGP